MTATEGPGDTTLRLRRTLAAGRDRVFKAWTDAAQLQRWFAPTDRFEVRVIELHPRPGGTYRVEMKSAEGAVHRLAGTYRVVQPPEKLVFTWRWEGDAPDEQETLVTVEFKDRGASTELVLTHERFPSRERMERDSEGWSGCLDRLDRAVRASAGG